MFIAINSLYISLFYNDGGLYYLALFSELNYTIPLLYGPLLWFYTKALTEKDYKISKVELWHFAPFVIFLLILLTPLVSNTTLLESKHLGYPLIKIVLTPFYLVAVLHKLYNYRVELKDQYSYHHKMNHMWLSWIVTGAIILWCIATIGFLYNEFNDVHKTLLYDFYVLSFVGVFLFVLAFVAFNKTDIMSNFEADDIPKIQKQSKEPVDNLEAYENILSQLKSYMEEEEPFLDPLLSINGLAEKTGIPQYKISYTLNNVMKQSFFDFINNYRVKRIKTRLQTGEAEKYSLLAIALDCGFNSKASFNRVFKKLTGTTPTQYLKTITQTD